MKRIVITVLIAVQCVAVFPQQKMTLADCRETALRHNEDLQKADIELQKAELDRQIAYNAYLPKLDGSVMGLYMKDQDIMGNNLLLRGTYVAGLNLTQPIYVGGQITAANRLARLGKECQQENLRKTRAEVLAEVDKSYYTLISVSQKVRMLEAFLCQMNGLIEKLRASVSAELATGNDMLRVEAKRSEVEYQLQKARNGEELCRLALGNALGLPITEQVVPIDTVFSVEAISQLDENFELRPELSLLKKNVEVKETLAKKERSNFLPTIALSVGYSYYGNLKMRGTTMQPDGTPYQFEQKFSDDIPMAMLSVSIPIFHWGSEFKKAKKARLDVTAAQLDLQKNRRLLSIEVRQAVQNVTSGYQMVQTAQTGQQQADENLRVMQLKYDCSMATLTDLLDAQAQWQQAHSNLIEAQAQYKIYQTEYLRATGRL
ncbi:TolC family protein [Prevotella copri]|uniref:TolC family protein n=1 Tax=Segatella copri TaxID=165179 RepID=A0A6G1U0W9_9BACT|nr:TolC family protein [Segatella copri]MQN81056.1 TolC family protein [Segatella copri]